MLELFFNNIVGLRPATLLKKRFQHRRFPVKFAKFLIFKGTFFIEDFLWLLLILVELGRDFSRDFSRYLFISVIYFGFLFTSQAIHMSNNYLCSKLTLLDFEVYKLNLRI